MKKLIVVIASAALLSGCATVEKYYPAAKAAAATSIKKKVSDMVENGDLTQKQADKILAALAKGAETGEKLYLEKYGDEVKTE